MTSMTKPTETMRWIGDECTGSLSLIDQTRLPLELIELNCTTVEMVWEAIKQLRVRGAPAIGIAAAYGVVVGLQATRGTSDAAFDAHFAKTIEYLAGSRPT